MAKEAKRAKLAREDFQRLLRHTKDIKPDVTWEKASALVAEEPEFKAVRACTT